MGRPSGTLYVVSAGVGAPLYGVSDECDFTHTAQSVRSYVIVQVEGRKITYASYDVMTESLLDAFSYTK
jgi:hypothetical protein